MVQSSLRIVNRLSFLAAGFNLQCRVSNKPYDIFGTWYSEHYLLNGNLFWLAHLVTTSVLWLNKANQETASEHVPIMSQLFRYHEYVLWKQFSDRGTFATLDVSHILGFTMATRRRFGRSW